MKLALKSCLWMLLAFAGIPAIASADIVDNLQAHWALDGDATSASGNHDGTYVGEGTETYATGKFGQGIDLEADNDEYLSVTTAATDFGGAGGDLSFSAWFTTESFTHSWQTVVATGENDNWRFSRQANANNSALAGGGGDIRNAADISTGAAPADGFFHVAGVFEAGVGTTLYVNGVAFVDSTPVNPALTNTTSIFAIGNNPDRLERSWDGIIDDVAIWDAALSEEEVLSI